MYQSMETWPRRRPRRMGRKTKNEFGAALQGFRRFEGRHAGPRRRVTAERSERFAAPAGRSAARAQVARPRCHAPPPSPPSSQARGGQSQPPAGSAAAATSTGSAVSTSQKSRGRRPPLGPCARGPPSVHRKEL